MKKFNKIFGVLFLVSFVFVSLILPIQISAATGISVDSTYKIVDQDAVDGDILVTSSQGLTKADTESTNKLIGVLQDNPLLVYKSINDTGRAVSMTGDALVNVTDINGDITTGDFITSSPLAGKGEKELTSGYVIGTALENFTSKDGTPTTFEGRNIHLGKIKVALRIEYAEITTSRSFLRLLDYLNAAVFKNVQSPEKFVQIIRYIGAGLIVIVALLISFATFSRSVSKGVEAIGRNPLARNTIQFSIIISTLLTIAIALIGLIASFILLRL